MNNSSVEKKKRGRKPKVSKTINSVKKTDLNDNIILHLPIVSKLNKQSKEDEILTYNPDVEIPKPNLTNGLNHKFSNVEFIDSTETNKIFQFNQNEEFHLQLTDIKKTENAKTDGSEKKNQIKNIVPDTDILENIDVCHDQNWYSSEIDISDSNNNNMKEIIEKRKQELEISTFDENKIETQDLLKQFKESNKTKWPSRTSIYCWWCCHPFSNPPCAIPHKYKNSKYHVYGVFCSPECAAAYNFDEKNENMFERYSLLNMLYKDVYNQKTESIKLAQDRKVLKIFGGHLNVKEFRKLNTSQNNKEFKVINPPMISIIPQVEYNFSDEFSSNFTQVQNNVKQVDNSLVLKRRKPIYNTKNTLESCMNIS